MPTCVLRVLALKRETETEMERARVFVATLVRIVSVIKTHGADRQLVAQTNADRVTHIIQASRHVLERIGRVREQVAGINKDRPEKLPVNREDLFHVEDREELPADRMAAVVWAEVAFDETANSRAAAVEETFVDRNFGDR